MGLNVTFHQPLHVSSVFGTEMHVISGWQFEKDKH